MARLQKTDPQIFKLIKKEEKRQEDFINLIPSENYASQAVLKALGSVLTNKYAEGYPGRRYYGGNLIIDEVEALAQKRAKKLFKVPYANVQPYSGSPANLAVYLALCQPGDSIMGQSLFSGGHLTHGWRASITGKIYKAFSYSLAPEGFFDFKEIRALAARAKPRIIWAGATAYPRKIPWQDFSKIADEVGAYLVADIAHVAGLIVGGVHPSPVNFAHIITTTTHKTLRGPRAGMIMVTKKGLQKDPELVQKIDQAVFPGLQGGPHENTVAAIATCLKEAEGASFKKYITQVVKNAQALAKGLKTQGFSLVTGGTDNHLILIDLITSGMAPGGGLFFQEAAEAAGIVLNKNTIPNEPVSPFNPSGARLGTPAVTTRGMKEEDMEKIAFFLKEVFSEIKEIKLSQSFLKRKTFLKEFRKKITQSKKIKAVRKKSLKLCHKFPLSYRS